MAKGSVYIADPVTLTRCNRLPAMMARDGLACGQWGTALEGHRTVCELPLMRGARQILEAIARVSRMTVT